MSGLKYHGGMKGLYAMLALTEASLVDDDVDTTEGITALVCGHEQVTEVLDAGDNTNTSTGTSTQPCAGVFSGTISKIASEHRGSTCSYDCACPRSLDCVVVMLLFVA